MKFTQQLSYTTLTPSTWLIIAIFLGISACSHTPKIHTLFDPNVDFSSYQSYGFVDKPTIDTNKEYDSFVTQYLKASITKELNVRGFKKSAKPELLINFYIKTKEKIRVYNNIPHGPSYYSYRFGYHPWPHYHHGTRIRQYTEGTLHIDLIDAKAKQLIWEGIAVGRARKETTERMQIRINTTVKEIFNKFPVKGETNLNQP